MKKVFLALAVVTVALVACNGDKKVDEPKKETSEITSTEDASKKTADSLAAKKTADSLAAKKTADSIANEAEAAKTKKP